MKFSLYALGTIISGISLGIMTSAPIGWGLIGILTILLAFLTEEVA